LLQSVIVWSCFWKRNRVIGFSDLYILDCDFELKNYRYSVYLYLDILEDQIPKYWQPGLVFIQDRASIYTAKAVKDFFTEQGIPVEDWLLYSPDINPIEHVWHYSKKYILEYYLELDNPESREDTIKALAKALVETWNTLPDSLFELLIKSIPNWVNILWTAKGWYTKY
jgi:transposase